MTVTTRPRESKAPLAAEVVHLSAEYLPYARTGGLAEAVTGLATYQATAGITTTALLVIAEPVCGSSWVRVSTRVPRVARL